MFPVPFSAFCMLAEHCPLNMKYLRRLSFHVPSHFLQSSTDVCLPRAARLSRKGQILYGSYSLFCLHDFLEVKEDIGTCDLGFRIGF